MDMTEEDGDYVVIFRRYRRLPDGTMLDAHKYGYRVWPIKVRREPEKA